METGDPVLDSPESRQRLEDAFNNGSESTDFPGYQNEVGGWCRGSSCSMREGNVHSVRPPFWSRFFADFGFHTHPNTGIPIPGNPKFIFADDPSRKDYNTTARSGKTQYIITPNSIYRITPVSKREVRQQCFQRWSNSSAGC